MKDYLELVLLDLGFQHHYNNRKAYYALQITDNRYVKHRNEGSRTPDLPECFRDALPDFNLLSNILYIYDSSWI